MVLTAMFLNPTDGPPWTAIVLGISVVGMVVGFLWIRRIAAGSEDLNSSFWRSHPHGGRGSRVPSWSGELPPLGWVAARAWVAIALGSIVAALAGPIVLRRWDRPLEEAAALAAALWVAAIMAAIVGTWWMLRIMSRDG